MNIALQEINDNLVIAPFLYFVVMAIVCSINNSEVDYVRAFRVHLTGFLLCQFCFHLPLIFQWLTTFRGNPYRQFYGELQPLVIYFYLFNYFVSHILFTFIVVVIQRHKGNSEVAMHFLRTGKRFVWAYIISVFIQGAFVYHFSHMSGLELIKTEQQKEVSIYPPNAIVQISHTATLEDNTSANGLLKNTEAHDTNFVFPIDTIYEIKLLATGVFHGDEVLKDAESEDWFALYKEENKYNIKRTKISTVKVRDEIMDKENEKTGVRVQSDLAKAATNIFLISRIDLVEKDNISTVQNIKSQVFPGDSMPFDFLGNHFNLFATGKLTVEEDGLKIVTDYKLYMEDKNRNVQYLVAMPSFDEKMISILFIGDIDNDKLPDLIVDTSNHYNRSSPTLYLSSKAQKGKLVKVVAMQNSVGC